MVSEIYVDNATATAALTARALQITGVSDDLLAAASCFNPEHFDGLDSEGDERDNISMPPPTMLPPSQDFCAYKPNPERCLYKDLSHSMLTSPSKTPLIKNTKRRRIDSVYSEYSESSVILRSAIESEMLFGQSNGPLNTFPTIPLDNIDTTSNALNCLSGDLSSIVAAAVAAVEGEMDNITSMAASVCNETVPLDKSLIPTNSTPIMWQQNNVALDFDAVKAGVDLEAVQAAVAAAAAVTNFPSPFTTMPLQCPTSEIQNLSNMAHDSTVSDLINEGGNIYSATDFFLPPQSSAPSHNYFPAPTKAKIKAHNEARKAGQQAALSYSLDHQINLSVDGIGKTGKRRNGTPKKATPRKKNPNSPAKAKASSPAPISQSNQKWDEMLACLKDYIIEKKAEPAKKGANGETCEWDGNVPTNFKTKDGKALGRWINNQRSAKSKGSLKPDRDEKLFRTGLKWSVLTTNSWTDMMNELHIYVKEKAKDGNKWDGNVPTNYKIKSNIDSDGNEIDEEKNLGRWINRQRSLFQGGRLRKDRQLELEAIGLRWSVLSTSTWQSMFEALCLYAKEQEENSQKKCWDGNVPANYKTEDNPPRSLGRWVNRQRSAYAKKKLKAEFVEKLNKIGLRWSLHEKKVKALNAGIFMENDKMLAPAIAVAASFQSSCPLPKTIADSIMNRQQLVFTGNNALYATKPSSICAVKHMPINNSSNNTFNTCLLKSPIGKDATNLPNQKEVNLGPDLPFCVKPIQKISNEDPNICMSKSPIRKGISYLPNVKEKVEIKLEPPLCVKTMYNGSIQTSNTCLPKTAIVDKNTRTSDVKQEAKVTPGSLLLCAKLLPSTSTETPTTCLLKASIVEETTHHFRTYVDASTPILKKEVKLESETSPCVKLMPRNSNETPTTCLLNKSLGEAPNNKNEVKMISEPPICVKSIQNNSVETPNPFSLKLPILREKLYLPDVKQDVKVTPESPICIKLTQNISNETSNMCLLKKSPIAEKNVCPLIEKAMENKHEVNFTQKSPFCNKLTQNTLIETSNSCTLEKSPIVEQNTCPPSEKEKSKVSSESLICAKLIPSNTAQTPTTILMKAPIMEEITHPHTVKEAMKTKLESQLCVKLMPSNTTESPNTCLLNVPIVEGAVCPLVVNEEVKMKVEPTIRVKSPSPMKTVSI
eukprot:CAMPEP_0194396170 /NCGR_PEP_ID=MMETSP0174-20130528/124833_1 /TAXON_ID=216777 /ORGANISM="Proboscia alata, Strain PI-D3" /LENGTH=1160 /DNA_ID=CAMNT_0039192193 /DNA_START=129 /DNA_END=3611 /DNA_ORIENTATION=+